MRTRTSPHVPTALHAVHEIFFPKPYFCSNKILAHNVSTLVINDLELNIGQPRTTTDVALCAIARTHIPATLRQVDTAH